MSCKGAISINVYGRGDRHRNDGPSHMGIALYSTSSVPPKTCRIHHVRCPDEENFIYDPRSDFPLDGPVLWGRCVVADTLSEKEFARAEELLTRYGEDASNLPEMGLANCQDWVAGASGVLESEGVLPAKKGESAFWREQVGLSGDEMAERCKQTGRVWVAGERKVVDPADVDARFWDVADEDDKKKKNMPGKLADNPAFKNIGSLLSSNRTPPKKAGLGSTMQGMPRGFLVSSPFFSNSNDSNENEVVTSSPPRDDDGNGPGNAKGHE